MDPKKQECLGLYLYGAGYYSREDNTLGIVTGNRGEQAHFCLTCPKRAVCEDEHEKLVREAAPEVVEIFDRKMHEAVGRGIAPTVAALFLSTRGLDPFARVAVENFKRGHADRGRVAGPLVK